MTYDQLRQANETNDRLCSFVSSFFDSQNECENGYWSGGDEKQLVLEGTSLPVKLDPGDDGEPTPLSQLIGDLYDLLRRHYAAIKYEDLERFKVPQKVYPQPAAPADENVTNGTNPLQKQKAPKHPAKTTDPLGRAQTRRAKARDQNASRQVHPAGPSKTTRAPLRNDHITTRPLGEAQRVLDTHEEMLEAFERILFVDDAKTIPRDLSTYKDDKWYDQFDGLKSSYNASDKRPSGGHSLRSGEKRKAVADVNETWLRQQKRHNPGVRGETRRDLAPIEENDES